MRAGTARGGALDGHEACGEVPGEGRGLEPLLAGGVPAHLEREPGTGVVSHARHVVRDRGNVSPVTRSRGVSRQAAARGRCRRTIRTTTSSSPSAESEVFRESAAMVASGPP